MKQGVEELQPRKKQTFQNEAIQNNIRLFSNINPV